MEWCHEIPFINAAMIYRRRSCVIEKILQHRYFVSMCLAALTHISQDVSAITRGFHLVKYGESVKKYFLISMFWGMFYVMNCRLVRHAHVFLCLSMYLEKNKR